MDHAGLLKASAATPALVDVPPTRFLMLDGVGRAGDDEFKEAMSALYTLAYQLKFAAKKRLGISYKVSPAEGLYWDPEGAMVDDATPDEPMAWRLMIALPDEVDGDLVDEVRATAAAKKGLPLIAHIRLQTYSEGRGVQLLHVGPYAAETPTLDRMRAFAAEKGLELTGPHHEIYLSDPSRTAPEKMKTILRHPARPVR